MHQRVIMRLKILHARQGRLTALAAGLLAAGIAGGCSDQPTPGTGVVESPEAQNNREKSVKDAIPGSAHEPQAKRKAAQRRAAAVDLGGAGAFGPQHEK